MRTLHLIAPVLLCLSLALLAGADDPARGQNGRSDHQLLQGTWKIVKQVKDGQEEDATAHPRTMTFTGSRILDTHDGSPAQEGTFTLDPAASPKRITMKGTKGPHANSTFEAIYQIEGNTLKLAFSTTRHAGTPPKGFTGGPGEGLLVLERERS